MFDYDKEIETIEESMDILNVDGKIQVKRILEYLKICPYIDVIADHMSINKVGIYGKLKYHLGENKFLDLMLDLDTRKYLMKEEYKKQLGIIDDKKQLEKFEGKFSIISLIKDLATVSCTLSEIADGIFEEYRIKISQPSISKYIQETYGDDYENIMSSMRQRKSVFANKKKLDEINKIKGEIYARYRNISFWEYCFMESLEDNSFVFSGDNRTFMSDSHARPDAIWGLINPKAIEIYSEYQKLNQHYNGDYETIDEYLFDRAKIFFMPIIGIDDTFFKKGISNSLRCSMLSFIFDIYKDLPDKDRLPYWYLGKGEDNV